MAKSGRKKKYTRKFIKRCWKVAKSPHHMAELMGIRSMSHLYRLCQREGFGPPKSAYKSEAAEEMYKLYSGHMTVSVLALQLGLTKAQVRTKLNTYIEERWGTKAIHRDPFCVPETIEELKIIRLLEEEEWMYDHTDQIWEITKVDPSKIRRYVRRYFEYKTEQFG